MGPIVEVQNVSKKYTIQHLAGGYLNFRDRILNTLRFNRSEKEDFFALQGVSFNVGHGESIGIIGRNGAGKSTLLKVLSKITPPTTGRIIIRGRVASLLEVGTGFHPELTGRENIFFNGSLLGMKRKEIETKFDEIIDFSGTERFLDTPLKHFSSGMQLRLAFSVAAFLEPEILIIDEVLAVGDAGFQKKCLGKMENVSKSGRTILFVSHNMAAVGNLCQRAILMDKGGIVHQGPVSDITHYYQQSFNGSCGPEWNVPNLRKSSAYVKKLTVNLQGCQPAHTLAITSSIISVTAHKDLFLAFDISNSIGVPILQAIPKLEPFIKFSNDEQVIKVIVQLPPLIPDQYKVSVWIGSHNMETMAWEKEIVAFEITDSPSQGRNFPHTHQNGFIVPNSWIADV